MPARVRASIPGMEPKPIPFSYELSGCVNGAQVGLRIEGPVARHEVRFETEVTSPGVPLLWEERTLALAAIDPVVLISLDLDTVRGDAASENFRVESGLYDDGEKAVGRFVLSGCWSVEKELVVVRAQLVEGWLNFEPMERVTRIGESSPMSVLSTEVGKVVTTRAWAVETSRGNSYLGVSVSRGCSRAFEQGEDRVLRLRWTGIPGGESSHGSGPREYRLVVEGHAQP